MHQNEYWIKKGVCTGKKSDWDFAPAAPLAWVQPAKPLENSAYPGKEKSGNYLDKYNLSLLMVL